MRKLFERTVRTAVAMKLVDLAVQAVDGTKVVANASVNRSYDAEGLRGLLDQSGPTMRVPGEHRNSGAGGYSSIGWRGGMPGGGGRPGGGFTRFV